MTNYADRLEAYLEKLAVGNHVSAVYYVYGKSLDKLDTDIRQALAEIRYLRSGKTPTLPRAVPARDELPIIRIPRKERRWNSSDYLVVILVGIAVILCTGTAIALWGS